ncbi:MAG TPA: hypothetical protein VFD43_07855 [Planctomycetota bacterium]|nr:hypothetical protein [Planctomycetota bacterium]
MAKSPDSRPHRSFPREGFLLHVEPDGLEIQVTDYHARPLRLSWALLESLRAEAQAARSTGQGGQR